MDPSPLLLLLAGAEMFFLGSILRSKRFVRAINAKHSAEIDNWEKAQIVTGYYNELSAPRQRRFEHFKAKLDEIRANYKTLHSNYPDIVNGFLDKMKNLQLSYVKLLFMQDKFPSYLEGNNPADLKRQIEEVLATIDKDPPKLKEIKLKRIELMKKRIIDHQKANENQDIVTAQLQTIEEMIQYIKDQGVTLKNTSEENGMIDNMLMETESLSTTISDLENIMSSDYNVGGYELGEVNEFGLSEEKVTE